MAALIKSTLMPSTDEVLSSRKMSPDLWRKIPARVLSHKVLCMMCVNWFEKSKNFKLKKQNFLAKIELLS
jgi:hypothetical protein